MNLVTVQNLLGWTMNLPSCSSDRHSPSKWITQDLHEETQLHTAGRIRERAGPSASCQNPHETTNTRGICDLHTRNNNYNRSNHFVTSILLQHKCQAPTPHPCTDSSAPTTTKTRVAEGTLRTRIKPPSHFELPERCHKRRSAVRSSRASSFESGFLKVVSSPKCRTV